MYTDTKNIDPKHRQLFVYKPVFKPFITLSTSIHQHSLTAKFILRNHIMFQTA